jgi:hypothetical protein
MAAWAYHLPPARSAWSTSQWMALCHPLHHMTFGHHTLPVGFVCHHMGSSRVILRMTRYGRVHVMVAWHICYAASISITAGLKSEWRLGLKPACLTTMAPGVLAGGCNFRVHLD